jgi:DNA-binding transcriptional regulator YdaS (Cro superfamily)
MPNSTSTTGLDAAIEKAGGPAKLAKLVGIHRSAITSWRKTRVPAERVPDIEAKTGVSRHQLRPDLWPAPSVAA